MLLASVTQMKTTREIGCGVRNEFKYHAPLMLGNVTRRVRTETTFTPTKLNLPAPMKIEMAGRCYFVFCFSFPSAFPVKFNDNMDVFLTA